jgi:cytoskeletal protein RodZ
VLYIVLILVLAALALLVTALITATSLWAWVSIGLSVLAGLILLVDWLRRRKRAAAAEPSTEDSADEKDGADEKDTEDTEDTAEDPVKEDAEPTALLPSTGELGDPADVPDPVIEPEGEEPEPAAAETTVADAPAPAAAATAGSAAAATKVAKADSAARENAPGEEETAADDLAIVSDLEDEVVVVDEYPRYHLVDCGWLSGRDTIPIAVGEARQLGFTPCSRCGPDAVLAAAHR